MAAILHELKQGTILLTKEIELAGNYGYYRTFVDCEHIRMELTPCIADIVDLIIKNDK
jgi:hypothetical protein